MNTNIKPVTQNDRIVLLDALRGLALFGILMVNMPVMFEPISSLLMGAKPDMPLQHVIAESFIKFFFEGKFYVIFSFLFGYGFWLFLSKSTDNEGGIVPLYRRRLFLLLLFGLAHIALLWAGDILVFYSLFGFLLILFRKSSNRKVIGWAIGIALIPTVLNGLMTLLFGFLSNVSEAREAIAVSVQQRMDTMHQLLADATVAYTSGSFGEMVSMRFSEYATLLPGILFFYPVVLAMFLVGMWAARTRIIAEYDQHLPFFRKTFWWGFGIGLIGNIVYVIAYRKANMATQDVWAWMYATFHTIAGIALGAFYVSTVVLLFAKGRAAGLVKLLAPVGRMALTNYLMQSLITSILFLGWGFGLFGKIELWQGILITIAIFTMQIPLSIWWLGRFRFGPVEWLWRTLTYGYVQPMKK
jgi:uncharacterized protein